MQHWTERLLGPRRHVLIHAHLFKNAGTTFDFSLQRSFGEQFVDHRDDAGWHAGEHEATCSIARRGVHVHGKVF